MMKKIFYHKYDQDLAWPEKGQCLIKAPGNSTPYEAIAVVDWLEMYRKNLSLPVAFKDCGDFLVEAMIHGGDGSHADRFLIPILYLYRHALELRLKEGIRIGMDKGLLLESDKNEIANNKIMKKHELMPLWEKFKLIVKNEWPSEGDSEVDAAESLISELHQIDGDGMRLRYSHDNKENKYIRSFPDQVDLLHLRRVFEGLWNIVDGSIDVFSGLYDNE